MPGANGKILVVDDELVIRELMAEILTDEGYEVETAPNGIEALERLRTKNDFVLLFTDIMMPQMNGIELIREARTINPGLIPIVMTGYATLETARAAVKEGAYDYVLKPFSLSDVKLAVSNAFDRYHLANENARLTELTELFKISESIAGMRQEQVLLDFVLEAALDRVGAERGSIMLTTKDGAALKLAASVGVPEDLTRSTAELGNSISGWVATHRLPLHVDDIRDNPDIAAMSHRLDNPSFISMPLERKGNPGQSPRRVSKKDLPRVLAVLNVSQKKTGERFTEADLKILRIVANHAAAALENVRLFQDLEEAQLSTLKSMARALEAKDPYTHGHSERVRNYSMMAAIKLGMSDDDIETLRLGAMLHDVGKIGVSDAILNKVENLTSEEWDSIKRHPVIGFDVLEPVPFLTKGHLKLIRSHHERLDGSGYPDGLKGDELDDQLRVLCVADTYDAMSGDRAYRRGIEAHEIVKELRRCSEKLLDERVTNLFIELIESGEIARYETEEPQLPE